MKILKVLATICLLLSPAAFAQNLNSITAQYDAVRDFSLASNPNGVWSYGALTKFGAPLSLYTATCTNFFGLLNSFWGTQGCNTPMVFHNDSTQAECFETICVPPNYLDLDIGNNGQGPFSSVVRWTAPQSGTYTFYGRVEGLDWFAPTSTDFRVIYNSNSQLLKVVVNSYDQPFSFMHNMTVSAGDTVDFAIDLGQDHGWMFDSTGIQFKVNPAQ